MAVVIKRIKQHYYVIVVDRILFFSQQESKPKT